MNQIAKQNISYSIVPKAAEQDFIKNVIWWYENSSYDGIPTIINNMFYYDRTALEGGFLDFVTEVGYFYYKKTRNDFNPDVFPVPWPKLDYEVDERHNYFLGAYDNFLEDGMVDDMKRWMDSKHLFYIDNFNNRLWNVEPEPKFINSPLKEVW